MSERQPTPEPPYRWHLVAAPTVRCVHFRHQPALHLRPTGSYDGVLHGYRRRGAAAWGYGAHPLNMLASVALRLCQRPRLLAGLAYLSGWLGACLRRARRVEPETRRHLRRGQLQHLRAALPFARSFPPPFGAQR